MLTTAELREHVGDGPGDDLLEKLLTAAYQSIEERLGPSEEAISELLIPSGSLVRLSRRAHAVVSVLEGGVALDVTDFILRPGGRWLQRLHDERAAYWRAGVDVSYYAFEDDAERDRVALALVQLDVAYQPGLTGITIGSWTEQYAQGERSYSSERGSILATLRQPRVGVW